MLTRKSDSSRLGTKTLTRGRNMHLRDRPFSSSRKGTVREFVRNGQGGKLGFDHIHVLSWGSHSHNNIRWELLLRSVSRDNYQIIVPLQLAFMTVRSLSKWPSQGCRSVVVVGLGKLTWTHFWWELQWLKIYEHFLPLLCYPYHNSVTHFSSLSTSFFILYIIQRGGDKISLLILSVQSMSLLSTHIICCGFIAFHWVLYQSFHNE